MIRFLLLAWSFVIVEPQRHNNVGVLTTTLSSGYDFPLVGIGVGNLQHELIVQQISSGIQMDTALIDTAQASHNEHLILRGIQKGDESSGLRSASNSQRVDVITKVWYTHLGYERTMMAVKNSLDTLGQQQPNIRLHILLHWPRCYDEIEWMNCEAEEEALPKEIKEAGPPPHVHPETAFIESWRALEDLYLDENNKPNIASIGVSNFGVEDLRKLEQSSNIQPHILQGNVWSYIFDNELMMYCKKNKIHFQAYNVLNGIVGDNSVQRAPRSFDLLENVASEVGRYTVSQVVLKFLIDESISVIPRTSTAEHLIQNSQKSLAIMPILSMIQRGHVQRAIRGLLQGRDEELQSDNSSWAQPLVRFVNLVEDAVDLFWKAENGEEHLVAKVEAGEGSYHETWPGHIFVAYNNASNQRKEFVVSEDAMEQNFHIEF